MKSRPRRRSNILPPGREEGKEGKEEEQHSASWMGIGEGGRGRGGWVTRRRNILIPGWEEEEEEGEAEEEEEQHSDS